MKIDIIHTYNYISLFIYLSFSLFKLFLSLQFHIQKQPPEVFYEKSVLRSFAKFTGKHLYRSVFLNKVKKEILAQVFSVEFSKISKNIFFTEHLRWLLLFLESGVNKDSHGINF